jgi:hypothetical protein
MGRVRDIIQAADEEFRLVVHDAKWEDCIAGAGDNCDPCGGPTDSDTFIAQFSPQHVSLMEAVVEAAQWLTRDMTPLEDALADLSVYRAERGLL